MTFFGYLGVLGLFIGLIILCFFWGIWEYKKPEDSGPLLIDLDRTTRKRLKKHKPNLGGTSLNKKSARSKKWLKLFESNRMPLVSDTNETVRVRGDLRIPKGEVIPYDMIVEGNLISREDVTFKGGLNVKGLGLIGARNRLEKSIVCQKELFLFEDVIVANCVDCEKTIFIKTGVRIGVDEEGGGMASAGKIYLENAEGPLRIHAKKGIKIVKNIKTVTPKKIRHIIEVENP